MMKLQSIAVYCGSNFGRNPNFRQAAKSLANELAERQISLLYGGGDVGLMGELADTMLAANGKVTGVIPKFLVDKEIAHTNLTELVVTDSMHERKKVIADRSDAFIMLPGGIGTLDEFFESWTWSQLGLQNKPLNKVRQKLKKEFMADRNTYGKRQIFNDER